MDKFSDFFCNIVSHIFFWLPSTPDEYKLSTVATALGSSFPLLGRRIFYDVIRDLSLVLSLVVPFKIAKILPAKF